MFLWRNGIRKAQYVQPFRLRKIDLLYCKDHFKYLKKEAEGVSASAVADTGPKLDLAFKAGQTIRINIPSKKGGGEDADDLPEPATTQKKRPQGYFTFFYFTTVVTY